MASQSLPWPCHIHPAATFRAFSGSPSRRIVHPSQRIAVVFSWLSPPWPNGWGSAEKVLGSAWLQRQGCHNLRPNKRPSHLAKRHWWSFQIPVASANQISRMRNFPNQQTSGHCEVKTILTSNGFHGCICQSKNSANPNSPVSWTIRTSCWLLHKPLSSWALTWTKPLCPMLLLTWIRTAPWLSAAKLWSVWCKRAPFISIIFLQLWVLLCLFEMSLKPLVISYRGICSASFGDVVIALPQPHDATRTLSIFPQIWLGFPRG